MWNGVIPRFSGLAANLRLTQPQIDDGLTKYRGITKCLNEAYWGSSSETSNSLLVGSWGKFTRMRPPRDVDMLFQLPVSVYNRFQQRTGNKQSALLQEVKGVLEQTYSTTTMRGDGQVVIVRFNTTNVEVVPAFLLDGGRYWICDTNDGGKYKLFDPVAEMDNMQAANARTNKNARRLVKYMKAWQAYCSVPMKSFWIELLAIEFLDGWQYRQNSVYYHDWMVRDFLAFIYGKAGGHVIVPGTSEFISIGDEWKSRVESAYGRAAKAERFEWADNIEAAGDEWQKIFGEYIPKYV